MDLTSKILEGRFVRLEPLSEAHREELRTVADDPALWTWISQWGHGQHFDAMFDSRLRYATNGEWIHFSVRDRASGKLIGQTGYMAIDTRNERAEIGATWYTRAFQGGATNPECKCLLLGHAFACGAIRVELKTHARNARSRAAIAKLGAKEEGVLRRHMKMPDGTVRDTVYFSILDHEWPAVKAALEARIAAFG